MGLTAPDEAGCPAGEDGWQGAALDTAHLRLRPLVESDSAEVCRLLNDWEVVRSTSNLPFPYRPADADAFVATAKAEMAGGRAVVCAIEERVGGALVGCVGATLGGDSAEIGYWIARRAWGRGYATEAVRRCLRLLFVNFRQSLVWASVMPDNPASRRVMDKAGMSFHQRRPTVLPARGVTADLDFLIIDRPGWEAHRAARPTLLVAAAALVDRDGRVLLCRRPAGKAMAGQWEFPGGKLHPGETPEAALERELAEELGIDVTAACLAPLAFASHDYDSFHLLMPLFACRRWRGLPEPREGQQLAWVRPPRLADYVMPPADLPLVAILRDWL
ncbi:MAG TPA: GNAT family N-acetyltransferase [Rhodospirillaceae bacterium]|nr:GNAT family N-acetyltransferase [Rhodospirillaceae bacterium]